MVLNWKKPSVHRIIGVLLLLLIHPILSVPLLAQSGKGIVLGKVTDGVTNQIIFGVAVSTDSTSKPVITMADGSYRVQLRDGLRTIRFHHPDYQVKITSLVPVEEGSVTYLDIILIPRAESDSVLRTSGFVESKRLLYNPSYRRPLIAGVIANVSVQPGTDRNGAQLLKRLNGVIVNDDPASVNNLQQLTIAGLPARYAQVLFNGTVMHSLDPVMNAFPFELLPVEAVEKVQVQRIGDPSLPAAYAGGTVSITTEDFPDHNFLYVLAGAQARTETPGEDFYTDHRDFSSIAGFPGKRRDLPAGFPTARSKNFLQELNPQEQVYHSARLNNNLASKKYNSIPGDRLVLGFGKIIPFKGGEMIGISAFLTHQYSETISSFDIHAAPDVAGNPFPFSNNTKPLVRSMSNDRQYRSAADASAVINAAILFKHSKISLKSFLGNQFVNQHTVRTGLVKPDEDTLANSGMQYKAEHRQFLNLQVAGEHALGKQNNFIINWRAAYGLNRYERPDERNFLLRQDSADASLFEIARPSAASLANSDARFTNSGRQWAQFTDHNFTALFDMQVPFQAFSQSQVLSGGVYIESRNRIYTSELLLVNGPGYYTIGELLAAERYFPGGLTVQNYYNRYQSQVNSGVPLTSNRGNYTANTILGASYAKLESRITQNLSVQGGIRLESNSHLVSNTHYVYFAGFRNPRITPLDQNNRVNQFSLLPSVNVTFQPLTAWRIHAAWFKTVNRPQFHELTGTQTYDATSFMVRRGNPILATTTIDNFDAGISLLGVRGSQISVSGFYKKMDMPIEYLVSAYANAKGNQLLMPHNTPPAELYGVQASFKIQLGWLPQGYSPVTIFAGGNYTHAKVKAGPVKSGLTPRVAEHSLSGTPEYAVNGGITLQYPRYPMLTILYNRTGDYNLSVGAGAMYTLSNGNSVTAFPSLRVQGRNQLDVQFSQKLFKSAFQVVAGVQNLLQDDYIVYQDLDGDEKMGTALRLTKNADGKDGFYQSGTDNTVIRTKLQALYYITISYLFK